MRIAVYSDARLPSSHEFPGHGLGKINLTIAEGLSELGHSVDFYAGQSSNFFGTMVLADHEQDFYRQVDPTKYDAIIDGGHHHQLGRIDATLPIINVSHDREGDPGINAVFVSEAHGRYYRPDSDNRVVYNGINTAEYEYRARTGTEQYLAFLAAMFGHKGPKTAIYVGGRTGRPVYLAGPGSAPVGKNSEAIGPVYGDEKANFLRNSFCLLVPASIESGGLTLLEAACLGVPTVAFALGGLPEYSAPNCILVEGVDEMVAAVETVKDITQKQLLENRNWVASCRSATGMVSKYEKLCNDVANGERW